MQISSCIAPRLRGAAGFISTSGFGLAAGFTAPLLDVDVGASGVIVVEADCIVVGAGCIIVGAGCITVGAGGIIVGAGCITVEAGGIIVEASCITVGAECITMGANCVTVVDVAPDRNIFGVEEAAGHCACIDVTTAGCGTRFIVTAAVC